MEDLKSYNINLTNVNCYTKDVLESVRRAFVGNNFYWSPVNGFNIGAQKIDDDYCDKSFNGMEFIAYFGFGLFSGYLVDQEYVLRRLFKHGDVEFPYNLLFIEGENRTEKIYTKKQSESLELGNAKDGEIQLDTFYICRCVQFNMDESDVRNYTSNKYFNALLDVIFRKNGVSTDVTIDKNQIGAIEFKVEDPTDASRVKTILNTFIKSPELGEIIKDEFILEKIRKIYI